MKVFRFASVVVLAAVIVSMLAGGAFAAGSGPDSATAPEDDWQALPVGQSAWYAFNYGGGESQIDVELERAPAGAANFAVWTPETLRKWAATGVEEPVGRGSAGTPSGVLRWSGNFQDAGTYYVVVSQSGNAPANYNLAITGEDVGFPAAKASAAAAAAPAVEKAAAKTVAAKPEAAAPKGTGPGDALTASDEWITLQPGAKLWYVFDSEGDEEQNVVRLSREPANGVAFSVWTPEDLRKAAATGVENPVGRGSPNSAMGNDLVWVGGFSDAGKYYVRVEQKGSAPAYYHLQIN